MAELRSSARSASLRVSDAAEESARSPALIGPVDRIDYAQLAARAAALDPAPGLDTFVAESNPDTVVRVFAALERGTSLLPLPPALSEAEQDRIRRSAAAHVGGPSLLLTTSGSTGSPKLAALPHEALLASALASASNLSCSEQDRWLCCLPLGHAGGLSILTRCLVARAAVVLVPKFDPGIVLTAVEEQGVTLLSVVPAMLAQLLAHPRASALHRLRGILVGGAEFGLHLRRAAAARELAVLATYGSTEMASQVATQRPGQVFLPERLDSGYPLAGVSLRIGSAAHALEAGQVGKIFVNGSMRMSGYVGDPPLDADDYLATNDIGYRDAEGRLFVLGRSDDVIVTGGEKVHPVEVESALMLDERVQGALVVGVPDGVYGQVVAVLLVLMEGARAESVLEAAASRLARFKRPRRFLVLSTLPAGPNGKPDRVAAREYFAPGQ